MAWSMRSQVLTKAVGCWQFGILLLATCGRAAVAVHFNLYEPCQGIAESAASVPQCRREPGISAAQQAVAVSAAAPQLPIDMRLPCEASDIECHENVDVLRIPQPPLGPSISSCSHDLMPWSPFPCTYDTNTSHGIPGQPTDLCYNSYNSPTPSLRESGSNNSLATNLTTDGYNNVYFGTLPDELCSKGSKIVKMLLTLDFRLAAGRQFDRTYSFQIVRAVVAFGTCSEPSRLVKADKYWSVTVDVSYLQTYLQPNMPTRFSLANVLTNTYNVPIWAKATLNIYYKPVAPSRRLLSQTLTLAGPGVEPLPGESFETVKPLAFSKRDVVSMDDEHTERNSFEVAVSELPADVPSEVIPLTIPNDGYESRVSVAGDGDSPVSWPNVTFELPDSFSEGRNIYRAQLVVVPKANGCEEFWAMNPPAGPTNSTCGDVSTGDPYREVRVYVDGQLAGFYPIFYTMYTGGVDPRLWTATVASHAYSLPRYTFDLSPWLGLLNTPANRRSDRSNLGQSHTITVEIFGATGSDWILANTLLIWRSSDPDQIVTAVGEPRTVGSADLGGGVISKCEGENLTDSGTCLTESGPRTFLAETWLKVGNTYWSSFVRYHLSHYSNVVTYNNTEGTSTWNQRTRHTATWYMGLQDKSTTAVQQTLRQSQTQPLHVDGSSSSGHSVMVAANKQGPRHAQRHRSARPKQHGVRASRLWDGTGPVNVGEKCIVTQNSRQYDWVNVGGQYDMAPFVFSFNETLFNPTVYVGIDKPHASEAVVMSGKQQHYQQALMLSVYNTSRPACTEPTEPTHTVVLFNSIGAASGGSTAGFGDVCEYWSTACAFCAPGLSKNEFVVNECLSQHASMAAQPSI